MANSSIDKITVNVKLENGTDEAGNIKTVSVSLGNLSEDNYNADKALAVVSLLAPCLSKTVSSVEEVTVKTITAA